MIKSRSLLTWDRRVARGGRRAHRNTEAFRSDVYAHYFYCDIFMGAYIKVKTFQKVHFNYVQLTICQLYLTKAVLKP